MLPVEGSVSFSERSAELSMTAPCFMDLLTWVQLVIIAQDAGRSRHINPLPGLYGRQYFSPYKFYCWRTFPPKEKFWWAALWFMCGNVINSIFLSRAHSGKLHWYDINISCIDRIPLYRRGKRCTTETLALGGQIHLKLYIKKRPGHAQSALHISDLLSKGLVLWYLKKNNSASNENNPKKKKPIKKNKPTQTHAQ